MARRDDPFPVDLPGPAMPGRHPLRWTATAIATATAILLLGNAISLDGWAAELAPDARTAVLVEATGGWREATERSGLAAPRAALHAAWKRAQAARLPGQAAAE